MNPNCFVDKKNKKWVVDGYYIDGKGTLWTLLVAADDFNKHKKVKGML